MFFKNFGAGPKWLPCKIVDVTGPVSFRVLLENGRNKQCHQDQLHARLVDDNSSEMSQIPEDESVPISITTATETADETMRQLSSPVQPEPTTQPLSSNTDSAHLAVSTGSRVPSSWRQCSLLSTLSRRA